MVSYNRRHGQNNEKGICHHRPQYRPRRMYRNHRMQGSARPGVWKARSDSLFSMESPFQGGPDCLHCPQQHLYAPVPEYGRGRRIIHLLKWILTCARINLILNGILTNETGQKFGAISKTLTCWSQLPETDTPKFKARSINTPNAFSSASNLRNKLRITS